MTSELRCDAARARLPELAEASAPHEPAGGPVDAALARHAASCPACAAELRLVRETVEAARQLARCHVPEPSGDYWDSFLPSIRERVAQRGAAAILSPSPSSRVSMGRAVAAAAAVLMLAGAAASLMAPPRRPGDVALLRQAGERMERAMSANPRLSGVMAAELLGVDPMPGIEAGEILEALREIAPLPAMTGTWPGIEDGEMERSIDLLDEDRAQRLLAELSAPRG